MLQKIKPYMMPVAMMSGAIFYSSLQKLSVYTPWLIGVMLLISYSNISLREIRISKIHLVLLATQVVAGISALFLLKPFSPVIAEGAMICILAPTATSAVVITGMLGGNMGSLTTYTLLCNTMVVLIAPVMFSLTGELGHGSVALSVASIFKNVFTILLLPVVLAMLLKMWWPKFHQKVKEAQSVSFLLWSIALALVTARTIQFVIDQGTSHYRVEVALAIVALIICLSQFYIGRRIGRHYGETIAGGQGLGQKNTLLAIWMAQTYLNPLASIAPGAYVLWQNVVNSYQVWHKGRLEMKRQHRSVT